KAHALCDQANIRYEDYLDRILQIPRTTAKSASKSRLAPGRRFCARIRQHEKLWLAAKKA
ncbi:MAG: hypothetical protein L6V90_00005, partial [Treponema succinifaciens]